MSATIELRRITKSFHGVAANQAVDFDVSSGEIHALLGENGAGKSTLMNIMAGIYQPDAGDIRVDGKDTAFASPLDAIEAGIGMVHQHFKLVGAFTVAENVHLGWRETPVITRRRDMERRTAEMAERFGLHVRPDARVSGLSVGEQQRVEILKVLARGARILVLDEPTAVLTPAEIEHLMAALRDFRALGKAVVLISHKLGEVLSVADRITVLRAGRVTAAGAAGAYTVASLAQALVGQNEDGPPRPTRQARAATVLELCQVRLPDALGRLSDTPVDMDLRAGEILGIAGIAGNGQRELGEVLAGRVPAGGAVLLDGREVVPSPASFAAAGIGHIPEDRLRTAVAADLDVMPNASLREYGRPPIRRGPWIDARAMRKLAADIITSANVMGATPATPFRNLSGGNQQRLVVRREMRIARKALIAVYPTRGLDIGAVHTLQQSLLALRAAGVGVVLVSEELDEILTLSDRIAVLLKGCLSPIFDRDRIDKEAIGLLMGGEKVRPDAA